MRQRLERVFPGLMGSSCHFTSPETSTYNCIAWAVGDSTRWWWPDPFEIAYWPTAAPREETLAAFARALATLAYTECDHADPEPDYEKIAIYAIDDRPKHAARQLPGGTWTSKLGKGVDIEHQLEALVGEVYGSVAVIMKRGTNKARGAP